MIMPVIVNNDGIEHCGASMIDRALLHRLIDSLPDDGLQNVERALYYDGLMPSVQGRVSEEMAESMRRRLVEQQRAQADDWDSLRTKIRLGEERRARRMAQDEGSPREYYDGGYSSAQGFDAQGALLILTYRYYKGKKLEIAESISVLATESTLTYSQRVHWARWRDIRE